MATTHLIAGGLPRPAGPETTVCGVLRTVAKGNVSFLRSEVDCPDCLATQVGKVRRRRQPGMFTPQGLGMYR